MVVPPPPRRAQATGITAAPGKKLSKAKVKVADKRGGNDEPATNLELGLRIRALRESKNLSLAQLSESSGISGATLSRIENNKLSPTFGVLARVMIGLDIDWGDLVGPKPLAAGERLMSFAEPGDGHPAKVRASSAAILHSLDQAHSLPIIIDVRSRQLSEVGGLIGHRGEEFCYVLSGTLVLHLKDQAPRVMKAGASALFDSNIPHAYVSGAATGAKALIVVVRAYGAHGQPGADEQKT
jgi:transcriptional regulator with XRE-family HTH domain